MKHPLVMAGLMLVLSAGSLPAQQRNTTTRPRMAPPTNTQPTAPPELPPAVYEPQLLRLAEITGALSYLSDLCEDTRAGIPDGAAWRARLKDLLEAESSSPGERDRIAGAFNRGFSGYRTTYHHCTLSGQTALERLMREGAKLTQDLTSRYGN